MINIKEEIAKKRAYTYGYDSALHIFERACDNLDSIVGNASMFGVRIKANAKTHCKEYREGVSDGTEEVSKLTDKVASLSARAGMQLINKKVHDALRNEVDKHAGTAKAR